MTNHPINIIVIGVDPAPSKGLCVYCHYPEDFSGNKLKTYYAATESGLNNFATEVNALEGYPVLICWDAPLTMPTGGDNLGYYTRKIESIWIAARAANPEGSWASVQPVAGCSHWAISQKLLGFPRLANAPVRGALLSPQLITNHVINLTLKAGLYLVEVHPALALQVRLGSALLKIKILSNGLADADEDESWKLSGKKSYKNVSWGIATSKTNKSGFAHLWEISREAFRDGGLALPSSENGKNEKHQPGPSDHLDAWVAMRLGVLWLQGGGVKLYGNGSRGSFLLPAIEYAAAVERTTLLII